MRTAIISFTIYFKCYQLKHLQLTYQYICSAFTICLKVENFLQFKVTIMVIILLQEGNSFTQY